MLGKAEEGGPGAWASVTHGEDAGGVSGSWILSGQVPVAAGVSIFRVNQG